MKKLYSSSCIFVFFVVIALTTIIGLNQHILASWGSLVGKPVNHF